MKKTSVMPFLSVAALAMAGCATTAPPYSRNEVPEGLRHKNALRSTITVDHGAGEWLVFCPRGEC
ncbi:hypothetical protein SAMN02927924_01377 [Sphingobium faniae]|nr:hypothetical protein SAMN02927924_01377 [Sphingobium faniae]